MWREDAVQWSSIIKDEKDARMAETTHVVFPALQNKEKTISVDRALSIPKDENQVVHSPRNSHESCECSRLDPTIDVVQQSSGSSFDGNVVAEVLEVEDGGLFLDFDFLGFLLLCIRWPGWCTGTGLDIVVLFSWKDFREASPGVQLELALRLGSSDEFRGSKVEDHETDQEDWMERRASQHHSSLTAGQDELTKDDSEIPPLVRVHVCIGAVDVCISIDERLARNGASDGADRAERISARVAWSRADETEQDQWVLLGGQQGWRKETYGIV